MLPGGGNGSTVFGCIEVFGFGARLRGRLRAAGATYVLAAANLAPPLPESEAE
jgi:hypothetical protein